MPSPATVVECVNGTKEFQAVLELADQVLAQRRHVLSKKATACDSHVLGAFAGDRCVGFLRLYVQIIGSEEGRPPVLRADTPLTEGFVEAFGVDPLFRGRGIGSSLQTKALEICRAAGCWQIRSISPVSSTENYSNGLRPRLPPSRCLRAPSRLMRPAHGWKALVKTAAGAAQHRKVSRTTMTTYVGALRCSRRVEPAAAPPQGCDSWTSPGLELRPFRSFVAQPDPTRSPSEQGLCVSSGLLGMPIARNRRSIL